MDTNSIITEYKKKGNFDLKRKEFFDLFINDDYKQHELKDLINKLVRLKIEKDPYLLNKNKGKISALIQTELVKRHVELEKSNKKLCSNLPNNNNNNNNNNSNNDSNNSSNDVIKKDEEIDILDQINSLLDSYANYLVENEQIQNQMLKEIKS